MHFDNDIHGEELGLGHDRAGLFVGQHRHHGQHRVGAGGARLQHLRGIDDEILGKDRAVEQRPCFSEVIERSRERRPVGQHADRVGDRRIGFHRVRHGQAAAMAGGRGALHFHDEPRAVLCQRIAQAAGRKPDIERAAAKAARDFAPLALDDSGQDVNHGSPRRRC